MESLDSGSDTNPDIAYCAYNPAHKMPKKTLILHYTRCPDKKKNQAICPFNNCHVYNYKSIEEHKKQCPDRLKYEAPQTKNNNVMNEFEYIGPSESTESTWDDDDSDVAPVQGGAD